MFRSSGWSVSISQLLSHALLLGTILFAAVVAPASGAEKPKVRTITAFIRLDTTQYKQQVADTLTMLRNAKARFELAGYEVETIRISTQPFPEYTRGMSKQAILAGTHANLLLKPRLQLKPFDTRVPHSWRWARPARRRKTRPGLRFLPGLGNGLG